MLANFLLSPCANFLLFLLLLPNVFVNVGAREVPIGDDNYTVVFDAGSSGTRVHVFKFDYQHKLIQIDDFAEVTPGLGSYADDPKKAANSIALLLHNAVGRIPIEARSPIHVQLGATTGLTLNVGEEKLNEILKEVRELFKQESKSLGYENYTADIISGNREGAYMWVAMNYLLRFLGKEYSKTVGVINLGGASLEMSYAVPDPKDISSRAPIPPETIEKYITKHELERKNYHLYVHSYSRYGQNASREQILKYANRPDSCCILKGSHGTYKYNGKTYEVSSTSGSNFEECKKDVEKLLNVTAKCDVNECTFNGVWNGGGGAGQDELYLTSAFFSTAQEVNIITDRKAEKGKASPKKFKEAAETACALKSLEEAKKKYPKVLDSNLPFICMDLVYQYTLLTRFGLKEKKQVTLIRKVDYNGLNVNPTWALGSAIEIVSDVASTKTEANNMFRFWSHAYTE